MGGSTSAGAAVGAAEVASGASGGAGGPSGFAGGASGASRIRIDVNVGSAPATARLYHGDPAVIPLAASVA